jgi:ornithine carbamoyltransferase
MHAVSPSFHRRLLASASIDEADARALLREAGALRRAGANPAQRLKGRHIALLCSRADTVGARRLDDAATALGARVSRIALGVAWRPEIQALDADAARLLESLYDAVDVEDGPAGLAQALQARIDLPVFDGLGQGERPVLRLLPRLAPAGNEAASEDDRRALLQAALIGVLA